MLNALTKKLNGKGSDPAALVEALASLGRDTEAARRELAELKIRRHQALLDDADDSALDKIERLIARAESRIEKLILAEPGLRERLTSAQAAARQQRLSTLTADYRAAAVAFVESARGTAAAHAALVAIAEQARATGFEREVFKLPATPNLGGHALCAPELIDLFAAAIAGPSKPPTRPVANTTQAQAPRAPLPHERAQITDSQHAVSLMLGSSPHPPRASAPDDEGPLASGEVRAIVIRAGYMTPAGLTCRAAQKIRLSRELAVAAVRNGAIEILEETALAPAASTTEIHG
jgi:hypothetical protein